jgi:hypothetical protein
MERHDAKAPLADYVLLSTSTETLERGMNQTATRGYHLHPFSLGAVGSKFLMDSEILSVREAVVVVMEKRESPQVEYRVMRTWAGRQQFEGELNAAGTQGWELVATLGSAAVLERPAGSR